jgi:hypothetical protein
MAVTSSFFAHESEDLPVMEALYQAFEGRGW